MRYRLLVRGVGGAYYRDFSDLSAAEEYRKELREYWRANRLLISARLVPLADIHGLASGTSEGPFLLPEVA